MAEATHPSLDDEPKDLHSQNETRDLHSPNDTGGGQSEQRVCKLNVGGMSCSSCVSKIEKKLLKLPNVDSVSVSLVMMKAEVKYRPLAAAPTTARSRSSTASLASSLSSSLSSTFSSLSAALIPSTHQKRREREYELESKMVETEKVLKAEGDGGADTSVSLSPSQLVEIVSSLGFEATVGSDFSLAELQDNTNDSLNSRICVSRTPSPAQGNPRLSQAAVDSLLAAIGDVEGVSKVTVEGEDAGVLDSEAKPTATGGRTDRDSITFQITYAPQETGNRDFISAVFKTLKHEQGTAEGFEATVRAARQDEADLLKKRQLEEINAYKRAFLIGLPFAIIIMVLMLVVYQFVHWFHEPVSADHFPVGRGVIFIWSLATPVQFYCGLCFFRVAAKELQSCSLGMSTLVVTGSLVSYAVSLVAVFLVWAGVLEPATQLTDFFETSAMLVTFILLGKWLEARAKAHTGRALEKLMQLQAKTGILLVTDEDTSWENKGKVSDEVAEITLPSETGAGASASGESNEFEGRWVEVDVNLLHVGDIVKVMQGTVVPADGELMRGTGSVDESMLTGESVPVAKTVGDVVFGATNNLDGVLYIRVTSAGDQSMLNQIVTLVEDAQAAKAPIQAFSDMVSSVFVPIILSISAGAFIIWSVVFETSLSNSRHFNEDGICNTSINNETGVMEECWLPYNVSEFGLSATFGIASLVIACPCALGLAVPTTVMVATGLAARLGILIKGGDVLQGSTGVSAVLFDKTGTLTVGKPRVASARHIDVAKLRREANAERKATASTAGTKASDTRTIVLDVQGMRCMQNCGTPVQNVLSEADLSQFGLIVQSAKVDFPARQGIIVVGNKEGGKVTADTPLDKAAKFLAEEVEDIGFEATVDDSKLTTAPSSCQFSVVLDVRGMRCMKNCGTPVQNVLRAADLAGLGLEVVNAEVDFPARQARIDLKCTKEAPPQADLKTKASFALVEEVEDIGFEASVAPETAKPVVDAQESGGADTQQIDRNRNLLLLGCAEQGSNHPIAVGLTQYAKEQLPPHEAQWALREPDELQVLPGQGVKAQVGEHVVLVGNRTLIPAQPVSSSLVPLDGDARANAQAVDIMRELEGLCQTAVVLVVNGVAQGVFGLADEVRPESKTTVEALHRASIQVFMITGDNRMTAGLIASELGIPSQRVFAEVLPQDKADKVKQLQNAGVKVAMVGDGINDAPALAQADLGVAVASGTDIAAETANMVLLNSNPEDVVVALDVCRRAYVRIQLNLFISLVYNCLGIPFGFGLFYAATKPMTLPPAIAAVAMALSSVSVVLSALALNTYKRKSGREVQLTRVNLNSWMQSCKLGYNRLLRRRVEAEQLRPVVVATLEDPGDTSDSEEFTAMYCRMEDEGPMACDCPADVCTCASCEIHDIVTNTEARRKNIEERRRLRQLERSLASNPPK